MLYIYLSRSDQPIFSRTVGQPRAARGGTWPLSLFRRSDYRRRTVPTGRTCSYWRSIDGKNRSAAAPWCQTTPRHSNFRQRHSILPSIFQRNILQTATLIYIDRRIVQTPCSSSSSCWIAVSFVGRMSSPVMMMARKIPTVTSRPRQSRDSRRHRHRRRCRRHRCFFPQ